MPDFDGFGVIAHVAPMPDACGYCWHVSRDGDGKGNMVCGICGDVEPDEPHEHRTEDGRCVLCGAIDEPDSNATLGLTDQLSGFR